MLFDRCSLPRVQVEMEGLTGNISFTDEGKRKDYSLDVVEMTFSSETVKVSVATVIGGVLFWR